MSLSSDLAIKLAQEFALLLNGTALLFASSKQLLTFIFSLFYFPSGFCQASTGLVLYSGVDIWGFSFRRYLMISTKYLKFVFAYCRFTSSVFHHLMRHDLVVSRYLSSPLHLLYQHNRKGQCRMWSIKHVWSSLTTVVMTIFLRAACQHEMRGNCSSSTRLTNIFGGVGSGTLR